MDPKINGATQQHINTLRRLLRLFSNELVARGETHDQSKFAPEEADVFDEYSPKLSGMTYGSEEYQACLKAMQPALDHHYANNRHHPEHFPNGVRGMNLVDVCEMFLDWVAAGRRHADGNIHRSIDTNERRFELDPMLAQIFHNTAVDLGDTLEIKDQYAGRCKTCRHANFADDTGSQCALSSAPMWHYDGCQYHKLYVYPGDPTGV